jgi:DNA polymerase-3 subunit gamma/tau
VDREHVSRLAELLAAAEPAPLLAYAESLEEWAPDYAQILEQLAGLLERVALKQVLPDYSGDELHPADLLGALAGRIAAEDLQLYYQTAIVGRRDLPLAPDVRAGFRMTLLRMLAFRPAGAAAGGGGARAPVPPAAPADVSADPPARAVAATPATAAGADETGTHWAELLSTIELQGAARQLAANCVWLGRAGNLVRLALDPRSQVVRTRAQEDKLAQALSKHFGTELRVDIEMRELETESPARERERLEQERQAELRVAFAADPGVQSLQRRFGATIHPESVRPAKPG